MKKFTLFLVIAINIVWMAFYVSAAVIYRINDPDVALNTRERCDDSYSISDLDKYLININNDYLPGNISFHVGGVGVLFEWNDGKFNVVYDANDCTGAAKTFFECMLPYLNDHIKELAECNRVHCPIDNCGFCNPNLTNLCKDKEKAK